MNMHRDKSLSTPRIILLGLMLRSGMPHGFFFFFFFKLLIQLVKLLFKMIELIYTPTSHMSVSGAPTPSSTLHNIFILNICQFDRPERYLAVLICIFWLIVRESALNPWILVQCLLWPQNHFPISPQRRYMFTGQGPFHKNFYD